MTTIYTSREIPSEDMCWEYSEHPLPCNLEDASFDELMDLLEDHISNDEVEFEMEAYVEVGFPDGHYEGTYITHTATESTVSIKNLIHKHYNDSQEALVSQRSKHNVWVSKSINALQRLEELKAQLNDIIADGGDDQRVNRCRDLVIQTIEAYSDE